VENLVKEIKAHVTDPLFVVPGVTMVELAFGDMESCPFLPRGGIDGVGEGDGLLLGHHLVLAAVDYEEWDCVLTYVGDGTGQSNQFRNR